MKEGASAGDLMFYVENVWSVYDTAINMQAIITIGFLKLISQRKLHQS